MKLENVTVDEIRVEDSNKIILALEPYVREQNYCSSSTCAHATHPATRGEVTADDIHGVLKSLGLISVVGIGYDAGKAKCFDYFNLYYLEE